LLFSTRLTCLQRNLRRCMTRSSSAPHTLQRTPQRRLPFGIHANNPVHGGQAGVERHEPEPGATA
jgi:hypothetical protein